MIDFLTELDTDILLAINGFRLKALDQFMFLLSSKLVWVPLYVVALVLVIRLYGWRSGLLIAAGAGLAVCLADQACSSLIRPLVERMRPSNPLNPVSSMVQLVNGYHGGRYGFPSCHAANTVAVALFLSMVFRYCRMIVLTLAVWVLLNCYSRMYLGVHYPGDIVAGALVGLLAGLIAYRVTFAAVSFIMHKKPEPLSGCEIRVKCGEGVFVVPDSALFMLTGLFTVVVLFAVSVAGYYC